jgi:8-oxo-dGTP diphosphatase
VTEADEEAAWLVRYNPGRWARPSVTVDLVVFTVRNADLKLLLIRRKAPPHRGGWALPGGFVGAGDGGDDQGESLDVAAARELKEETALPDGSSYLEQLYTFGEPGRDPRTRVITVAYYALIRPDLALLVRAGDDAAEAEWVSVSELDLSTLAFDHARIVEMALERIRGKIDYTPIAFRLVPEHFTMAELRQVYEGIKGRLYDASNFRRRFARMKTEGVILPAPGRRSHGRGRPAKVFRVEVGTSALEVEP